MAQFNIYFDKDGVFKESDLSSLAGMTTEESGRILCDFEVFSVGGGSTPPNLYADLVTCLKLPSLGDIPDWITSEIEVVESSKETRKQLMSTNAGFTTVTCSKYKRKIKFGVLPQSSNGEFRVKSFPLKSGYYKGLYGVGSSVFLPDSDSLASDFIINIFLDGQNGRGAFYNNPYYKGKIDDRTQDPIEILLSIAPININVNSEGTSYNLNKLSLCAKQYLKTENEYKFNGIISLLDSYSDYTITSTSNWIKWSISHNNGEDIENLEELGYDPFLDWINFTFNPNESNTSRTATIIIDSSKYSIKYEITITQDGVLKNIPDTHKEAYITFKAVQVLLPYLTSSKHYYAKFNFENITDLVASVELKEEENWLHVDPLILNETSGVIPCGWATNNSIFNRTAYIILSGNSTIDNRKVTQKIAVVQLAYKTGKDEATEIIPTDDYVVIDDNTGEDYNSSSLLFKDNSANIYETLESKDNTLFLGNYYNTDFSLQVYNSIGRLDNIGIIESTMQYKMQLESSSNNYPYTPDMTLNSQLKRFFKYREIYSLGLVFIRENGTKSTVFYVGNYPPSNDPYISKDAQNNYYINRRIALVTLDKDKLYKLRLLNVIGVIPVCAQRDAHKVICLGFLNPTVSSNIRNTNEGLTSLYNWFLRLSIDSSTKVPTEWDDQHNNYLFPEFLYATKRNNTNTLENNSAENSDEVWTYNSKLITLNTPEVEVSDILTNAELEDCLISHLGIGENLDITYTNSIQLNINGKYLYSRFNLLKNGYSLNRRETCVAIWHGYVDTGTINEIQNSDEFINNTKKEENYELFYVYPWQRNVIGGEGPDSTITSKKYFTSLYIKLLSPSANSLEIKVGKANIYRDTYPALLKLKGDLYQGNIDYIINPTRPYKAYITLSYTLEGKHYNYPKANTNVGVYAGYGTNGDILAPINLRYMAAPHIVLNFDNSYNSSEPQGIICAELFHSDNFVVDSNDLTLSSLIWTKCGDIVPFNNDDNTITVLFIEGDYFYGRFDSLRTYPYALDDVNSVTDIVSGMLCSRVNLDARCDRNRGIGTAIVTPLNFNIFNTVYNLANNYFTYRYYNLTEKIYERKYSNSIQWSMTKSYGNKIDDWCNIQEVNTLDLDGDKGALTSLLRLNNNIIAFLSSGISLILYNESMQISSSTGVPIEIANSGKVNGKRYLYETLGCQNAESMTTTSEGIYFVDAINKTFYKLKADLSLLDLCVTGGMKSWGLSNIDNTWKCWYDIYLKEVIFVNNNTSIAYSDMFDRFLCFVSYEGIDKTFALNGRTYMFKLTINNNHIYNNLWLKNAIDDTIFFSIKKDIEIEIIANQEPTLDKTFTNIEYRADGYKENNYISKASFTFLKIYNEYQTGMAYLNNTESLISALKKKFRTWYIEIPRNGTYPNNRDRIRNQWCNIILNSDMNSMDKFIVHDIQVLYLY